jgi:CelD/BcsL family acetyltransferase involved in cellulose biosynthesis
MPVQVRPQAEASLRDVAGDPELVLAWEELADRVQASPFRYPGFVRAWFGAFGGGGRLQLATVARDGRLVAALPLVRDGATLSTPANWHTPHVGVLAEDAGAAAALARSLFAAGARRLTLQFLGAADCETVAVAARDAGWRTYERTLLRSPYIDLTGGWEAFEQVLGSSANKAMRRRRRRLAELGEVTLEAADGSAGLDERYGELVRLEGMGWKGEQGTAIGSRPETLRFYRDVAGWAAQRGWLRIHLLALDGTPIAAAFGLRAHGVHASMKIGHDPAHQKLAPGVMLMHDVIREACEEGLRTVELLGDEDPLKRSWTSLAREWRLLDAFAPTTAGRAEWAAFTARRALRGARGRSAHRLRDLRERQAQPGD